MTTLPNIGLTQPTLGGDSGTWDDELNDNHALIDAHNHTSGKGLQVPTLGININADLTFGGLYAPINLHRITFASITAIASGNAQSLFVSSADNELYWRNHSGVNVKLTAANALNVAAFTGGIGGDYSSAGAAVAFDNANKLYTFKDGAGNWARNESGGIRLIEFGTAESVYVGLIAPSALAASYDVTLPLAAPGSTSLVQMSSTGVLTASNTVANAVVLSSTLAVTGAVTLASLVAASSTVAVTGAVTVSTTLGVTGAATLSSTLGVTGLITATAGLTAAANQHVTVSGTGKFKHGTRTLVIPALPSGQIAGSLTKAALSQQVAGDSLVIPIPLLSGNRIVNIRANIDGASTTAFRFTLAQNETVFGPATLATSPSSSGVGNLDLVANAINITIAGQTAFYVVLTRTSGSGTATVYCVEVDYDQP